MKKKTRYDKAWETIWLDKLEKQLREVRKDVEQARKMVVKLKKKRKKK